MVQKIETVCKKVGVDFLGWEKRPVTEDVVLRFRKDDINATLILPLNMLELMSQDTLTGKIDNLFNTVKESQS